MAYSKSYLCLGLGLFVILSSQALALQLPDAEATLPPGRKMTLDGRMEDFMRTVQIPENSKDERIFHGIRRGSGTILEAATVKKHFSYVPPAEAEERNDRNVKRSSSDEVDWILKPKTIPPGSGTRRLLGDFRHHIIKIPHHIN